MARATKWPVSKKKNNHYLKKSIVLIALIKTRQIIIFFRN